MLQFIVNDERCQRCGDCVADCPSQIIEREGDAVPFIREESEKRCLECQHCLAVCPTAAVSIFGKNPDDSLPLSPDILPSLESMKLLARGRRSVRQYAEENVDPGLLDELIVALNNAPTGVNRRELTFAIIDDIGAMREFKTKVIRSIVEAGEAGRLPDRAAYLKAIAANPERDILFRGAPHALIVSAPPDAPCPEQDVVLALAYFELLAQSAGLGTVWWGMFRWVMETLPELKETIGLPAGHHYYAMLFGVPTVRYPRTVQRDDAMKVKKITFS